MTILNSIAKQLDKLVKQDTWPTETEKWGDNIALYRNYVDGNHRLKMTTEMEQMFFRGEQGSEDSFNINYADMVVNKLADRLHIERIEADADNEAGTEWINTVLDASDFDELQIDVTTDTIADGDTFVMIDPPTKDNDMQMSFIHEPAWDNVEGIIPVYSSNKRDMIAAVKVWYDIPSDSNRVNIYYEDRIEKFTDDGGFTPYEDESGESVILWKDKEGKNLPLPVFHYRNRKKTRRINGISEVQKVVSPQDALNRTYISMIMTSELTAFQRLAFIGMTADGNVSPGSIWEITAKDNDGNPIAGIPKDRQVSIEVIEPGEISPFVEQAQFTIEQISVVSETPIPSQMGSDNASGEALKQRESGLVAKAKTVQIVSGSVWERLIVDAHTIQTKFGKKPPEIANVSTVWAEINTRDYQQVVSNAVAVSDKLDSETFLKEIEPAMLFSIADIPTIIKEKKAEAANVFGALGVRGFEGRVV